MPKFDLKGPESTDPGKAYLSKEDLFRLNYMVISRDERKRSVDLLKLQLENERLKFELMVLRAKQNISAAEAQEVAATNLVQQLSREIATAYAIDGKFSWDEGTGRISVGGVQRADVAE
jgi:hypothetical protein